MSRDAPSFSLFFGIDPKKANKPCVAAAFQAFETSLYLIGMQRWPAVITQVYLSIELLLRAHYIHKLDRSAIRSITGFNESTAPALERLLPTS